MTAPQSSGAEATAVFPLRSSTGVALVAATVFASMIGFLVVVALVPALLSAGDAHSLGAPLAAHHRTAMLVMAVLSVAAAVITAVFVTRSLPATVRHLAVTLRIHGCAVPEPVTATSHPSGKRTSP